MLIVGSEDGSQFGFLNDRNDGIFGLLGSPSLTLTYQNNPTPIPEPATAALALLGGTILLRRRRA